MIPAIPSLMVILGSAPIDRPDAFLFGHGAQLTANQLNGDEYRSQSGDATEDGKGDGFRLDCVLSLGHVDGRVVEIVGKDRWYDMFNLALDRRHSATSVIELKVGKREIRAARREPTRERWREDHRLHGVGVNIVLDYGVVEDDRSHEVQLHVDQRCRCQGVGRVRRECPMGRSARHVDPVHQPRHWS